jgi:hypothetical protein
MNDSNENDITGNNQMTCKSIFEQNGQIKWDQIVLDYKHQSVIKILKP